MPCTRPLYGQMVEWLDTETGAIEKKVQLQGVYSDAKVAFWKERHAEDLARNQDEYRKYTPLKLPCGKCDDCQQRSKLHWVLRCNLEAQDHEHITFATLTYEQAPPTLAVRDLQNFHKRLRKRIAQTQVRLEGVLGPRRYRHFSCGEYGERNGRPHYHAILFGLHHERDEEAIHEAWGHGFTSAQRAGPGAIAYVAGYVNKKRELLQSDEDGWVNPFIVMSRGGRGGHGIGGTARRWRDSWREYAIMNGNKIPVPRYLHNAWKNTATMDELEQLELDRANYLRIHGEETDSQRRARSLATATRLSHKRQERRDKERGL